MSAVSPVLTNSTPRRNGLFLWAIGGVLLLLAQAILRLSQVAWVGLTQFKLDTLQVIATISWIGASLYMEGYRGFQLRFVPRVLARAHHLSVHPRPVSSILAPLYAMAYFSARPRAKAAAWGITTLVVLAVLLVRHLPQPWRGIVDVGVVAGLGWGVICLLSGAIRRIGGLDPVGDPELSTVRDEDATNYGAPSGGKIGPR